MFGSLPQLIIAAVACLLAHAAAGHWATTVTALLLSNVLTSAFASRRCRQLLRAHLDKQGLRMLSCQVVPVFCNPARLVSPEIVTFEVNAEVASGHAVSVCYHVSGFLLFSVATTVTEA